MLASVWRFCLERRHPCRRVRWERWLLAGAWPVPARAAWATSHLDGPAGSRRYRRAVVRRAAWAASHLDAPAGTPAIQGRRQQEWRRARRARPALPDRRPSCRATRAVGARLGEPPAQKPGRRVYRWHSCRHMGWSDLYRRPLCRRAGWSGARARLPWGCDQRRETRARKTWKQAWETPFL
jgi:hypothetical protein